MPYRSSARAALLSAATFATFATFATLAVSAVYASTPPAPAPGSTGSVATLEARRDEALRELRRTIKVYPADAIYFGDALYVVDEEENRSDETMRVGLGFPIQVGSYSPWDGGSISSPEISGSYEFVPEDVCAMTIDYAWTGGDFLPGQKRVTSVRFFEFPPLEDWNAPFWAGVRDKLSRQNAVELRLRVEFARAEADYPFRVDEAFETSLVLKRRPENELERLARWFDATPANLFPERFPNGDGAVVKAPSSKGTPDLVSSGANDVEIGGKSYDPWLFVRPGFRKPSDPNAPTTVDGWRRLEAEFAPSTLRDEITLTCLLLEYYDAPEGTESDAALQALVAWLEKRPEPQRVVLTESLRSNRGTFRNTPLEEKRATFYKTLTSAPQNANRTTNDAK